MWYRYFSRENLCSFAVSSMLTSAFFATAPSSIITAQVGPQILHTAAETASQLGAKNAPNPSETTNPPTPQSTAVQPQYRQLTSSEVDELISFAQKTPGKETLSPVLTKEMGITVDGQYITCYRFALITTKTTLYFYPAVNGNDIFFAVPQNGKYYLIQASRDLTPKSGAFYFEEKKDTAYKLKDPVVASSLRVVVDKWATSLPFIREQLAQRVAARN